MSRRDRCLVMDCDSVKIQLKRVPMNDESGQHDVL